MRLLVAVCIALVSAAPAFAQSSMQSMPGMNAPASAADRAMVAGMDTMNHGMSSARMSGNPDQDFVAMMIPHHKGAVSMAEVELRYGRDPMLRRMAKAIIAAQNAEIAEMRRWQQRHPMP